MLEKTRFLTRLPFLVVAIILGAAILCAVAVRLSERLPINPWEAAIAMEAMRLNAGLPIYETGHATHLYGPLLSVALAGIFQITGLNLLAARIVFSFFAFALAFVLSTILCRGKSRVYWWFAILLFLGIGFRTNLILFSAQPDCAAALFAVIGLYLWITRQKSWMRAAFSIAFFLCAMLFKQTAAAFALIPIVHALMWKRRFSEFASSLLPAVSIVVALAAVRLVWPQMFWAMVTVPASLKVYYERALGISFYLIATFPVFLVALIALFSSRTRIGQRERWICSALIVLVPISIWTICKGGGGYSSLLFAYLAMTALFVVRLDAISDWITSMPGYRGGLASGIIAMAILFSFLIQSERAMALLLTRCGDEKYESAIALARRFGPGVISPQDPTIAFRANGYFGSSLFFELDTHALNGEWPSDLPESMQQELAASNYVLEVKSYVPTPVFERALVTKKFQPLSIPELSGSAYTLWSKTDG